MELGAWGPGGREQRFSWLTRLRSGRQPGDLLRSDGTLPPLSSFSIASLWPHEVGILAFRLGRDARVTSPAAATGEGWGDFPASAKLAELCR